MTRIKSHAQWQTTDGTLIDENDRATGRRYYVYTCYTCYARLYRHISLCSQRSMRGFWAFQILNKIVCIYKRENKMHVECRIRINHDFASFSFRVHIMAFLHGFSITFFTENISLFLPLFSFFYFFFSRRPSNTKIERFRSLGILEPTLSRAGYYSVEHKTLCDPWRPIFLWKRVEFNRATSKLRRMIMRNCRVRNEMSKFSLATSFGSK